MAEKPIYPRWGSASWNQIDGTKTSPLTSNPAETNEPLANLEQEVDKLKEIVFQQSHIIQELSHNLQSPPRHTITTKPRDIPVLELHQLQGLSATTQLQMFFELVEQCSTDDSKRVQVAKSRVSAEIAVLIHNHQTLHGCNNWKTLKELLKTQFSTEVNFDRAWQVIDSERYDWAESPQAFTNNFICRYAVLETRFAGEKLPNRDKCIKRKLWQGLSPAAKVKLEGFLDEDYPLSKFIDRIEHERMWLENDPRPPVSRVKKEQTSTSPQGNPNTESDPTSPVTGIKQNATSSESSDIDDLKKQIRDLTAQLGKLQTPSQPRQGKFCSHCQSNSHSLRECWRKPTRNSCFDCRQYGCWRGNKDCPGRPSRRT